MLRAVLLSLALLLGLGIFFAWAALELVDESALFNAHDNSAPFLRDLERTVARPWLHGGHGVPLFIRTPDAGRADIFSTIIPLIAP